MKYFLKMALLSVYLFAAVACSTTEQSYDSYKQTAIEECKNRTTTVEYNDCVERAKMNAEENLIDTEKHSKQ